MNLLDYVGQVTDPRRGKGVRHPVGALLKVVLLTSASPEKLPPKVFLQTVQKHWQIENGLHHVKDRTMKEDEHVTHSAEQETNLAILRNVAVSALNLLTPPKKRKESRPVEMLRYALKPLKLLKQLQTL